MGCRQPRKRWLSSSVFNNAGLNPDVRIVAFGSLDPLTLPLDLQRYHRVVNPDGFSDVVQWLSGVGVAVPARGEVSASGQGRRTRSSNQLRFLTCSDNNRL